MIDRRTNPFFFQTQNRLHLFFNAMIIRLLRKKKQHASQLAFPSFAICIKLPRKVTQITARFILYRLIIPLLLFHHNDHVAK
ncbi:hypothetical protein HMPREF0971_02987 [Segatella oris F0302]|uniref:Uncharacterized protein n=1 Tax=Segatella oris F0302 TaxID=649760 RepID=D1QVK9_9BACT|nr:hypothetical protein HMPREF0971_02987 [Segatella oris F0302]